MAILIHELCILDRNYQYWGKIHQNTAKIIYNISANTLRIICNIATLFSGPFC